MNAIEDTRDANRRAAWRWGAFVVGMLGLQVVLGIVAIMLATGDESVAIVPDYHDKALHWDDQIALQAASRSLGWICDVSQVNETSDVAGLRITLVDRQGNPIDLASGELQIYRHARAADVRRVRIPAGSLGLLELSGCFDSSGLWQVTIDVTDRSANRFAYSHELYVSPVAAKQEPPRALSRGAVDVFDFTLPPEGVTARPWLRPLRYKHGVLHPTNELSPYCRLTSIFVSPPPAPLPEAGRGEPGFLLSTCVDTRHQETWSRVRC